MKAVVKKSIPALDTALGFAAVAAVFSYAFSGGRCAEEGISLFAVVFFAVLGARERKNVSFKADASKKFRELIVPYLILCGVYTLLYTAHYLFSGSGYVWQSLARKLYCTLIGAGLGTLWILPAAFVGYIFYKAARLYLEKYAVPFLLLLLIAAVSWGVILEEKWIIGYVQYNPLNDLLSLLFKGVAAAGFMALGRFIWRLVGSAEKKLKEIADILIIRPMWVLGVVLSIFLSWCFVAFGGASLRYFEFDNPWAFLFFSALVVASVLFTSRLYQHVEFLRGTFQFFGKSALVVMVTFLDYKVASVASYLVDYLVLPELVESIVVFALILLVEAAVCGFVNKTPLRYIFTPSTVPAQNPDEE